MGYAGGMGSWKVQAPLVGQLPPSSSGSFLCVNWSPVLPKLVTFFFERFYLFIFRERGKEGEREGEKRQCVVASHMAPTRDVARNPGMCPDWESNR